MADSEQVYFVGACRICGAGPLGLRRCGGCGEIVVMCDECDAVWTDSNFSIKPVLAGEQDLQCPFCEASLYAQPSRWATKSEIDKLAWLQTSLQSGELELEAGRALPSQPDEAP